MAQLIEEGAKELINIVGDMPHPDNDHKEADIHGTENCCKSRSTDPLSASLSQSDTPLERGYHVSYVTPVDARPRFAARDKVGDRLETGTSTRNTRRLYVRRRQDPRQERGIPVIGMAQESHPYDEVNSCPERFLSPQGTPYMSRLMEAQSTEDGLQQKNIRMSKQLPSWMWYLLAKSIGIKLHPQDKPWFATFLHIITLTVAVLLAITGTWYTIYDVLSEYSKTTVLIGTVTLVIGFGWILLGIYAHKLAGKLFGNKNFAESVRMHTKTFMKISTAGLLTVIGFVLVGINAFDGFDTYWDKECSNIGISNVLCYILFVSKTAYAFICVVWTLLVGYVLMSVCRTHTIAIRRFMREMIIDAKMYETFWRKNLLLVHDDLADIQEDSKEDEWFIWDDQVMNSDYENCVVTSQNVFLESISGTPYISSHSPDAHARVMSVKSTSVGQQEGNNGEDVSEPEDNRNTPQEQEHSDIYEHEGGDSIPARYQHAPPIMSNDDLLFSYWKMSRRLIMTSRFLQRWMSSWISFIFIWCADYIVFWASHKASLTGIVQFISPLLALLILCSAYAEVNSEGQRLLKCICPTEGRIRVINFLNQQPLQMQVYSFAITYNTVLGVILAFSVAFASRIVLDEVL